MGIGTHFQSETLWRKASGVSASMEDVQFVARLQSVKVQVKLSAAVFVVVKVDFLPGAGFHHS